MATPGGGGSGGFFPRLQGFLDEYSTIHSPPAFFFPPPFSLSLSLSRTPGGRQDNCVHMSAVVDTHASDEIAMEENLSQWKVSGQIIRKAVTHH